MAKPKSSSFALASTATSSSSHAPECASSSSKRRAQNNPPPRPSSNLIALLATVAASSSTADGRPLSSDPPPPDFLCPYLSTRFVPDRPSSSRRTLAEVTEEEQAKEFFGYSPTPSRIRRVGAAAPQVPDRYVQGDDGRWRKEDSWTLYGSTYCDCATDNDQHPENTGVIPEVDDQADPTQLPSLSSPSVPSTSTDMTAKLPPGWNRTGRKDDLSIYIPILAVCLALFICVLIFGCVAWRRKRRGAAKDVEKKPWKQRAHDDDSESEIDDKQSARLQRRRLWAKTSARWRPNLKLVARRRRKRATATSSAAGSIYPSGSRRESFADEARSSDTLHEDDPSSSAAAQVASDPAPPATSSPDLERPSGEIPRPGEPGCLPDNHSHEEGPILPPDYRENTSNQAGESIEHMTPTTGALPSSHTTTTFLSDNRVSTAHIATDDKNLLARMASLASAPPVDDPPSGEVPSHGIRFGPGPSVPVIEELEAAPVAQLESMERDNGKGPAVVWSNNLAPPSTSLQPSLAASLPVPTYSREPSPHPPMFPAPPSKAQLAAPGFYEYPSTFEHDALEHDFPAPAPSFAPSAPEDDSALDLGALPCAPPLIDEEDEVQLGLVPSAPPLPAEDPEGSSTGAASSPRRSSYAHHAHTSSSLPSERTLYSPPDYLP